MILKTSTNNKLVTQNKTVLKTSSIKNMQIFKGNTNNIIIRDLVTNKIIGPKTLGNTGLKTSNNERNRKDNINKNIQRFEGNTNINKNIRRFEGNTNINKNIQRFKGNTNNIVIRDSITNEIIGPKTLGSTGLKTSNNKINRKDNIEPKILGGGVLKTSRNQRNRNDNRKPKLSYKKVFDTVELDKEPYDNIGANTVRTAYNDIVKIKRAGGAAVKTAKVIKNIPKNVKLVVTNIREIPRKVRRIPNNLKTVKNNIKVTATSSVKEISDIRNKIATGNLKGASKQVGKNLFKGSKAIGKKSARTGKKILKPTFKSADIFGKAGLKSFQNNFNKKIRTKENETDDIGSNATLNLAEGTKKTVIIVDNGIRSIRNLKRKSSDVNNKIKTSSTGKSKIKTLNKTHKTISQTSLKVASEARKQAVKMAQYAADAAKNIVMSIGKIIASNPMILVVVGVIIAIIIALQLLLSIFMTTHGVLTIDFGDNVPKWKTQMSQIDKNLYDKLHSASGGFEVKNSYVKTDWKDVLAVYYVKYGDVTLKNNYFLRNNTGGDVNTINPEVWDKIHSELNSHIGEAYVYGGSSPETGFDCSGLVQYCYSVGGINLSRTTELQCQEGNDVTNQDWQPGDLLFFMGSDSQNGLPGHVGVYIGSGKYIQAPKTGDVVKISEVSERGDLWGVRRVIPSDGKSDNSGTTNKDKTDNSKSLYENMDGTYADLFNRVGKEEGVDPRLLGSIAMQESSLNPNEVSTAGACGLCQFMPDTFKGLGFDESEIFNAETNTRACARYIKELLEATNGDLTAALQSYNLGPNAFKACGGDISRMPAETQAYANAVYGWYQKFSNGGLPDGKVLTSTIQSQSVDSDLKSIYDLFLEVQVEKIKTKKKTLTRYIVIKHTLKEVEDKLKMSKDDRDLVDEVLEYNDFNEIFGEKYNFKFKSIEK